MGNKHLLLEWHLLKRFLSLQGSANIQSLSQHFPIPCILRSTSQNHGATKAETKLLFSKQGHIYNYVYFSITLYPLMEVAILETSHLILLVVKTHQMRNCFMLHSVFTFVTPEVLTDVIINTHDFWDVMPCQLLHTYRCFCGAYSLIFLYGLPIKMEALHS
jgi:hypothetical protein